MTTLSSREAKELVDQFFDEIRSALETGEDVKLSKFGVFRLLDKPQRPGRNPTTGELVAVTTRSVTTFHASRALSGAVQEASKKRPEVVGGKQPKVA